LGRKHTHHSTEFRAEAVRLAETSGHSIRQVAMELGISNESLARWMRLARERPAGTPLDDDERAELTELPAGEGPRGRAGDPPKSSRLLRSGDRADPVTRFRFVEQEKVRYPVRTLCRALGVSPSGYYAWRSRGPSARERSDATLAAEIRRSHARSRGTYGVPRIHADPADAGFHVSRKRVARLMRGEHLAGVHRRRCVRTTIRDADAEPYPDLVDRDFSADGPDRLWVADITRGADPATSPRLWMPGAAGSSAGAWRPTCAPSSSRRRSTRRSRAVVRASRSSITRTTGRRAESIGRRNTSIRRCWHGCARAAAGDPGGAWTGLVAWETIGRTA
jgi:transposase-like protein